MRTRLIYSKRGGACFVPHIALAQMFSRSASRAGMTLIMTQGFSPRAKLSFGPELPAGVVALNEPVDMYFESVPENFITIINNSLPEGFNVSRVIFPDEDAPSLGKLCKHAEYLLRNVNGLNLSEHAENFYHDSIIKLDHVDDRTRPTEWLRLIINAPAQNPIGGFVKFMVTQNIIAGWQDMNIVRVSIGSYDQERDCVNL